MKIYLASRYSRIEEMQKYADTLKERGHEITAQWVDGNEEGKTNEAIAIMDYEDVDRADMVLAFTDPYGSSNTGGGRHTELGVGYALGHEVWIVGEREQIFHWLPHIRQFDTFEEVLPALDELENASGIKWMEAGEWMKRNAKIAA